MQRLLAVALFIGWLASPGFSQRDSANDESRAQLSLTADSIPFFLARGDTLLCQQPQLQYRIEVPVHTSTELVFFSARHFLEKRMNFFPESSRLFAYQVENGSEKISVIPVIETAFDTLPAPACPLFTDSAYAFFTVDSIRLRAYRFQYGGQPGCFPAMKQRAFGQWLTSLQSAWTTDERLTRIEYERAGKCLTVEQIGQVLALFEFDDQKLQVLEWLSNHVFDVENLHALNPGILLEQNRDELNRIKQTIRNQH